MNGSALPQLRWLGLALCVIGCTGAAVFVEEREPVAPSGAGAPGTVGGIDPALEASDAGTWGGGRN